ncbi:MAG TPA: 30S ribosomal protein S12 methylthiotransferase RimO [Candidatus Marinimicrobia bacterium]|nr:30S ribosomal protein S12 methylthiotransferase RimO [Candidatus Neomarinimicrobiota bacterium]HPI26873.1 30S ribosomal protein S12 methylthiotransferase RimO [Candidatus Neomarinimicrobiota bacterium]HPN73687.1 30S ribosomal protein S12 methylthiotransferase RimO [Candidatus Neomarinimicrobiota bacterium]HQO73232.1 30S ribosomal protein S12 methylthiotransferase RimO [Candidatus Neomarinimicrobiota bacterium]HQQ84304.1 30S ribosomal protein S12 methylthiotransferase RimO [Candidatus Neomari
MSLIPAVRSFAIISLGCPKNTVDSEILKGGLMQAGMEFKADPAEADAVIINTCGFIQPAKEESIETILETLRLKKTGVKKVVVMGCLSQRYYAQIKAEIPEIDGLFGVESQSEVIRFLTGSQNICPDLETIRQLMTPRHFAYLKIAEGCDNSCSFCAIPLIRGRQRSRSIESLLREAEYLKSQGVKELILIAQDTTRYGSDLPGKVSLKTLLEELLAARLFPWLRLMYANPDFWRDDLNHILAQHPEFCPYIDIPIQHASPRLLKLMNRGANPKRLKATLRNIRRYRPDVALRTSVMVGFPSETEAEFEELLNFIEEIRFERLGVFTYSAEEDTVAEKFDDDIPEPEKERRRDLLMQIQWEIGEDFARRKIGQKITVLIEEQDGDEYIARSVWDAPEIDCNVRVKSPRILSIGDFYEVTIIGVENLDLRAETNG